MPSNLTNTPAEARASTPPQIPTEARYRALFEAIDAGFCIIQMLFENDRPVDYRFLEVNPQFELQTGLVDPVGQTARTLAPGL